MRLPHQTFQTAWSVLWPYKTGGKTVNVRLSPEAASIYQTAAQQCRKLKSTLNRMEKLSRQALGWRSKTAS